MVRAALGQREEDDGTTCALDREAARTARHQAVRVALLSLLLGVGAAAIVWWLASMISRG